MEQRSPFDFVLFPQPQIRRWYHATVPWYIPDVVQINGSENDDIIITFSRKDGAVSITYLDGGCKNLSAYELIDRLRKLGLVNSTNMRVLRPTILTPIMTVALDGLLQEHIDRLQAIGGEASQRRIAELLAT